MIYTQYPPPLSLKFPIHKMTNITPSFEAVSNIVDEPGFAIDNPWQLIAATLTLYCTSMYLTT